VEISDSQFQHNGGVGGDWGSGGGGAGNGGAIYIDAANTRIHEVSIIDNLAQPGASFGSNPAIASERRRF
jgi:hypothetical protein